MPPTTIQNNVVVGLEYVLRIEAKGEIVDRSEAGEPMYYLHGHENIIPGLEKTLTGLSVGDSKKVIVQPEDAYGEYDPDDVQEVERALFKDVDGLEEGEIITLHDQQSGEAFNAIVAEIGDDVIVLDFNHPLAGETLYFDVKVVSLRDASADELDHGHPHTDGHHHH